VLLAFETLDIFSLLGLFETLKKPTQKVGRM
jgi:hypothetical protein